MTARFDAELVDQVCRTATRASFGGGVVDVVTDRLDGSVWVRLTSWPRVGEARRALTAFGLASCDGSDDVTLQVTGWDVRLLRRRLGTVLAVVDDLSGQWEATAELAEYCYDRRAVHGQEPDPADVLADVEAILRRAVPLPHPAPAVTDVDVLLELIEAAEDTYERRLAEHLDHAEGTISRPRSAID
jgi:hypothetical protein